jgi:hypothetical protein
LCGTRKRERLSKIGQKDFINHVTPTINTLVINETELLEGGVELYMG